MSLSPNFSRDLRIFLENNPELRARMFVAIEHDRPAIEAIQEKLADRFGNFLSNSDRAKVGVVVTGLMISHGYKPKKKINVRADNGIKLFTRGRTFEKICQPETCKECEGKGRTAVGSQCSVCGGTGLYNTGNLDAANQNKF